MEENLGCVVVGINNIFDLNRETHEKFAEEKYLQTFIRYIIPAILASAISHPCNRAFIQPHIKL